MKIRNLALIFPLILAVVSGASAQSTSAAAAQHSGSAIGQSVEATAASAGAGLKLASGVAAVPVWLAGSATVAVGTSTRDAGRALWDSATCNGQARPALDPKAGMPACHPAPVAAAAPAVPSADPSPAVALNTAK